MTILDEKTEKLVDKAWTAGFTDGVLLSAAMACVIAFIVGAL